MATVFRHPATIVLLVLLTALAVAAAVLTPWGQSAPSASAQADAVAGLDPDAVARGKEFAAALRPGSYLSLAVGLLAAVLLGLTPLGAKLVELCGRPFGGHWLAEAVLGGLTVVLIAQLATLPFAAWRHAALARYGMSTQGWGGWAADVAKSYGVVVVLAVLALAAFYTVVKLSPTWWWAWTATGAACVVVMMSAVYPVLITPLFNKFEPMTEEPLRGDLTQLAEQAGVPAEEVLVSDASRRTNAVNAYVAGLGPTRQIVVYDNLLDKPDAEVAAVVAHELGHAKNRDVWIGTTLGALGAAAAVCFIAVLGAFPGLLRRAGVESITSPRAVALVLAAVAVVGLLTTPVQSAISRQLEMRADQYALELTQDPDTFAEMQAGLAAANLADVDPPRAHHWFFGSHPTTAQRIAAAEEYRP